MCVCVGGRGGMDGGESIRDYTFFVDDLLAVRFLSDPFIALASFVIV